jgi:hypothetical protein
MAKKIAILVRDRQDEAIRMSVGAMLADDTIEVFVLDKKVESTPDNDQNMEMMGDLDFALYTNTAENEGLELLTNEQIAQKLLEYDLVIPY